MYPPERHQQYVKQSVGKPKRWKKGKKVKETQNELKKSQECVIKVVQRRQEREIKPLNPTPKIPTALIKAKTEKLKQKHHQGSDEKNVQKIDTGKNKTKTHADSIISVNSDKNKMSEIDEGIQKKSQQPMQQTKLQRIEI